MPQRIVAILLPVLVLLAACGEGTSSSSPVPAAPPGAGVYAAQRCALCHGPSGEGGPSGPSLRGLAGRWSVEDLLRFLRDPAPVVAEREELRAMQGRYPMPMGSYGTVPAEDLRLLAEWLLSR